MTTAGFATFLLMYCVQPLLPQFTREFGVSAATASLSLSLTTALLGVAMLVASFASDLVGRRPLMVASMLLAGGVTLVSAFAPGWPSFLATRAAVGIAFGGIPALAMAYLGEELDRGALGPAMGLYVAATGIGGMTSRLLTAALTDLVSWRFALATVGVLGVIAGLFFWRMLPPSRRATGTGAHTRADFGAIPRHLSDGVLRRLFALGFAALGTIVALYNYIGFRLIESPYHLSQTTVGSIFLLYLLGVGVSGWSGHLAERIGRARLLRACIALMVAGAVVTLARPLPLVVLGVALVTAGFFGVHSVSSGWVAVHAHHGRAQATSLYLLFYYLGSSVLGWLGGVVWIAAGWVGVTVLLCAVMMTALALTRGLRHT